MNQKRFDVFYYNRIIFCYKKKKNMYICSLAYEVIIITRIRISKLLGKTWPWGVTVSYGKSTDVTCKTHLSYLAAQLPRLVDLGSLVCDMNKWLSYRVSTLQSVVAGSISSGGDYGINSGPVFPYVVSRCSADFLVIQFTILIPLLKKYVDSLNVFALSQGCFFTHSPIELVLNRSI